MVINAGASTLTEVLPSTPQGGGSDSECHALQEIEKGKGEISWTSDSTQDNIDSRINQVWECDA